ncbi:C4-type zinc ribbon domain-containing protein [soil metagenome]
MKASPADQALLLDLQAIDTKLSQLDHRTKSVPEIALLAELARGIDVLRGVLATQSGAREDIEIELKRLESDVELVEQRIARDAERLQSSSSVKDVAALEQELAALRKRQFDLEEIELTIMERLEERDLELAQTRASLDDLESQVGSLEAARDAALAAIDAEREESTANRRSIAATVPTDLLALYEKQRARYGFGASLLRYGVSSVTGVKLLENEMQEIRAAAPDDVIMCATSEAILVRTAESGL